MHSDGADLEAGAGNFAVEVQRDAFVGLKAKRQGVGVKMLAALGREEDMRRGPKLNADFAGASGQVFAGTQIKWDTRPAPIINEKFERDVSFDVGIRFDLRFLTIARALLPV